MCKRACEREGGKERRGGGGGGGGGGGKKGVCVCVCVCGGGAVYVCVCVCVCVSHSTISVQSVTHFASSCLSVALVRHKINDPMPGGRCDQPGL